MKIGLLIGSAVTRLSGAQNVMTFLHYSQSRAGVGGKIRFTHHEPTALPGDSLPPIRAGRRILRDA
jgi:hypothetical protein